VLLARWGFGGCAFGFVAAALGDAGSLLFAVFARSVLTRFFSAASHCAWRRFISRVVELTVGLLFVAVRVDAGLLLSGFFAGSVLAGLFSTASHCAWRHFISLSNSDKETKQRKRLSTANS
jgi:hypothetical protein